MNWTNFASTFVDLDIGRLWKNDIDTIKNGRLNITGKTDMTCSYLNFIWAIVPKINSEREVYAKELLKKNRPYNNISSSFHGSVWLLETINHRLDSVQNTSFIDGNHASWAAILNIHRLPLIKPCRSIVLERSAPLHLRVVVMHWHSSSLNCVIFTNSHETVNTWRRSNS